MKEKVGGLNSRWALLLRASTAAFGRRLGATWGWKGQPHGVEAEPLGVPAGPTCSEMALKRQEASLAVSLRYSPRLPRYSSMVTSLRDFCPKYFFQPFCIVPGRWQRQRGGGQGSYWGERVEALMRRGGGGGANEEGG